MSLDFLSIRTVSIRMHVDKMLMTSIFPILFTEEARLITMYRKYASNELFSVICLIHMYIPGWISHRSGSTWVFVTDSGPCVDGKVIILFSLSVLMFHVHLCNDGWEWESSIARPLRCAAFHAHRDIYFHGRKMGHTIQRSMTCAITREPKIEVKARLNGNHKILNSSFFLYHGRK